MLEVRNWAIPRFYVRFPAAFVFFEPENVSKEAGSWGDSDLTKGIRNALPLKQPTDLYSYTLMGRYPRGKNDKLEEFVIRSLLSGSASVFDTARGKYVKEIEVSRDTLGRQKFLTEGGAVFLQVPWIK